MINMIVIALLLSLLACGNTGETGAEATYTTAETGETPLSEPQTAALNSVTMPDTVVKTEAEWKKVLTPEQYYVLRKKGTERAFSGKYNDFKSKGIYTCAACGNELFSSETKFDSGTGWPSFYKPLSNKLVKEVPDRSMGEVRTEVVCGRCGGHLGHVFDDGPKPTGLRYCLNSVALGFQKQ
ncbi:peptide-methionine (R)-S-oxide reductase MsrB [Pontibacter ruber]|uniref:Peptide methionine sulfoxide reductase MsrB n=1 Tax=Pontibacter ruber TaxID=1343895 RepID=A0ABW5D1V7_9BACT